LQLVDRQVRYLPDAVPRVYDSLKQPKPFDIAIRIDSAVCIRPFRQKAAVATFPRPNRVRRQTS
jgi:hypothetical protein